MREQLKHVEIGVRVSGEVCGQAFTGTVSSVFRRGGRSAIAADGTYTILEVGELETVHVRTDNPLTTPAGRIVYGARVDAEGLSKLDFL